MNLNLKELWRKFQFAVLIALSVCPIALLFCVLNTDNLHHTVWLYSAVYLLLTMVGMVVPGKHRKLYTIVACLLSAGFGAFIVKYTGDKMLLSVSAGYVLLLLISMGMAGWTWENEMPPFFYPTGIAIHVVVQVLIMYSNSLGGPAETEIGPLSRAIFFIFVLLILLSMGRTNMIGAGLGRHKPAASVRRKNVAMILLFFGIGALLAFSPQLQAGILAAVAWIKAVIEQLKGLLNSEDPTETLETLEETTVPVVGDEIPIEDPSEFSLWLEKALLSLFDVLLEVAVPILAILSVVVIGWLLYKLFRKLRAMLSKHFATVSEDYEDEITDTREGKEKKNLSQLLKNSLTIVNESKLTPAQRIRYRYQRLLKKHSQWPGSSTARENLPGEMAPYYEKARYSQKTVSAEEAETFAEGIKDL